MRARESFSAEMGVDRSLSISFVLTPSSQGLEKLSGGWAKGEDQSTSAVLYRVFVLAAVRSKMIITASRVGACSMKMQLVAKAIGEVLPGELLSGSGQGTKASSFLIRRESWGLGLCAL